MKPYSSLTQSMDILFEKLDDAGISEKSVLKSNKTKEHYETRVMFAFRKIQAARHHLDNVHGYIEATLDELRNVAPPNPHKSGYGTKLSGLNARIVVRRTASEYAYELSACLTAIKTSLDFIAVVCALHLPGVKADSIGTLIKLVEKGNKTGPLLEEVAEKLAWLKGVREYRDYLVHRLFLIPTSGWVIETIDKNVIRERLPVVVPKETPKFAPDTRRARMMDEEVISGLTESRSEGWIKFNDGTTQPFGHDVSFEATPGFIPIEDLMDLHISELEEFFESIVLRLIELDFELASPF